MSSFGSGAGQIKAVMKVFDFYVRRTDKALNLGDRINSSGNEYSPTISPDGEYFVWTSIRSFADKPLEKRMTYRELTSKLRSSHNGLGDIYQIDVSELKIQR